MSTLAESIRVDRPRPAFGIAPTQNNSIVSAGGLDPSLLMAVGTGLAIPRLEGVPIRHQLMAVNGSKLDDLTDLYSHVHALGQSRKIIRQYKLKPHVAGDTAGAARQVAEWGDKTKAALAPRLAAEIYGLTILAEDVDDEAFGQPVAADDLGRRLPAARRQAESARPLAHQITVLDALREQLFGDRRARFIGQTLFRRDALLLARPRGLEQFDDLLGKPLMHIDLRNECPARAASN